MAETDNLLRSIDVAISDQMNILISRRNDVWKFLKKPHSAKAIQKQLLGIRAKRRTLSEMPRWTKPQKARGRFARARDKYASAKLRPVERLCFRNSGLPY